MIDFSKACDMVDHPIGLLARKLLALQVGLPVFTVQFTVSFLNGQMQATALSYLHFAK